MVVILKCALTNPDEQYYPNYDRDSPIHICNLCSGDAEHNFNEDNLEYIFQIISQLKAGKWLLSFTHDNSHNESWNNPSTMMGKIFDRFYYNRFDFNGSNTKCIIIRLRNEAIQSGRFLDKDSR